MLNFTTIFSNFEFPTLPQTYSLFHTSLRYSLFQVQILFFWTSSAFQPICGLVPLWHSLQAFFIAHIIGFYNYLFLGQFPSLYEHLKEKDFVCIMTSVSLYLAKIFMIVLQYIIQALVCSRSSKRTVE